MYVSTYEEALKNLKEGNLNGIIKMLETVPLEKLQLMDLYKIAQKNPQRNEDSMYGDQVRKILSLCMKSEKNRLTKPVQAPPAPKFDFQTKSFGTELYPADHNFQRTSIISSFINNSGKILTTSLFGFAALGLQTLYYYDIRIFGAATLFTLAIPGSYVFSKYFFKSQTI